MLQHMSSDYESNHTRNAHHYKSPLTGWSSACETLISPLFPDDALARRLVQKINEDCFKGQSERYLNFTFVTPDREVTPSFRTVGKGGRTTWILDGGGHYEACTHWPTQQDLQNADQAPR